MKTKTQTDDRKNNTHSDIKFDDFVCAMIDFNCIATKYIHIFH